jgi:hypothetical protein
LGESKETIHNIHVAQCAIIESCDTNRLARVHIPSSKAQLPHSSNTTSYYQRAYVVLSLLFITKIIVLKLHKKNLPQRGSNSRPSDYVSNDYLTVGRCNQLSHGAHVLVLPLAV